MNHLRLTGMNHFSRCGLEGRGCLSLTGAWPWDDEGRGMLPSGVQSHIEKGWQTGSFSYLSSLPDWAIAVQELATRKKQLQPRQKVFVFLILFACFLLVMLDLHCCKGFL